MRLEDFEKIRLQEHLAESGGAEEKVLPIHIADEIKQKGFSHYPSAMATSEKLMRWCRARRDILKGQIQFREDVVLEEIADEKEMTRAKTTAKPAVWKKKYSSAEKRQRQLRIRLYQDKDYIALEKEYNLWKNKAADWNSFVSKVRRDYRRLEVDYTVSGGGI